MWKYAFSACLLVLAAAPLVQAQGIQGKVLILDNDRLMEGDIVQEAEAYRIRRGSSEIVVPLGKAKKLVGSSSEALAFLKTQAQLDQASERLRLAKWAHAHGLREHAIAETKSALEIQPNLSDAHFFLRYLQRSAPSTSPAPVAVPTPVAPLPEIQQIDVSSDCLILFNNKIQPILLNACGGCHSSSYPGTFRIYQANEGGSRASTQRNLAAAIGQIRLEKPSLSPLLIKSVSNHAVRTAMEHPPLKNKQVEPYRLLQMWVEMVAVGNPHLREVKIAVPPPLPSASDPPRVVNFAELTPLPMQASAPSPSAKPTPTPAVKSPAFSEGTSAPPAPVVEAADEFDPILFNQKYHGKK